jgi:hypothetical protein
MIVNILIKSIEINRGLQRLIVIAASRLNLPLITKVNLKHL